MASRFNGEQTRPVASTDQCPWIRRELPLPPPQTFPGDRHSKVHGTVLTLATYKLYGFHRGPPAEIGGELHGQDHQEVSEPDPGIGLLSKSAATTDPSSSPLRSGIGVISLDLAPASLIPTPLLERLSGKPQREGPRRAICQLRGAWGRPPVRSAHAAEGAAVRVLGGSDLVAGAGAELCR
jgi:hypothetical protein